MNYLIPYDIYFSSFNMSIVPYTTPYELSFIIIGIYYIDIYKVTN